MNTILQKRIEEAADEYQNLVIEETKCHHNHTMTYAQGYEDARLLVKPTFIDAADWALQNQWISVEEALPEYEECVLARFEGEDEVGAMFSQRSKPSDNLILDKNGFQVVGFTEVTHWMSIPKLKEGKK